MPVTDNGSRLNNWSITNSWLPLFHKLLLLQCSLLASYFITSMLKDANTNLLKHWFLNQTIFSTKKCYVPFYLESSIHLKCMLDPIQCLKTAVSLIRFSFLVSGQKSQEPGGEQRLCWCGQNLTVDNILRSRGLTVDSLTEYCSAVARNMVNMLKF